MAAPRTARYSARPAAVIAVLTLLAAVVTLLALSGTAHAADRNCDDFPDQAAAQAALEANPDDPDNLDSNHNGVACETMLDDDAVTTADQPAALAVSDTTTSTSATATTSSTAPTTTTSSSTTATSTTSTTSDSDDDDDSDDNDSDSDDNSSDTSGDDKDCADFASQADAQSALTDQPSDPDNLDADDDGIACEQHFGESGQQVQVHPAGGVDTGGF